ncbi:MAG TPA: type IV pilus assembly protein PilM [Abditibacteriaceae bacterium]|jgi:type IV pilus assembly protein PilM
MALFSRKKNDQAAPPTAMPTAPGTSGAANTPATEDFSAFNDAALSGTAAPPAEGGTRGRARKPDKTSKPARPRGLRGGAVVGLNIGHDSIKVVELKGKGTSVAVTGMGMVPTPAESISNGVVMSPAALSHSITDLLKQAGIKTRRIVASVAGTGSLIVRVIEVPRMSDNELADNMKVDVDRYIPFPPSEVIMDFKALRDLPSDPDAANMEVLLAAAQREVVDQHVRVIESSKLEPLSIDVEPLSAARSLTYGATNGASNGNHVDYNDVSALINIGATGSEISVLRGDVLVFTRTVPNGGNAFTQALADNLGLAWPDAERIKREMGDALPHVDASTSSGAYGTDTGTAGYAGAGYAGSEAAFGDTGYAPAATNATDDWSDFDFDATQEAGAAPAGAAPATAETEYSTTAPVTQAADDPDAASSADPFDLDFFNQGPAKNEPGEQHQQKEGDAGKDPFDFSDFALDDDKPAGAGAANASDANLPGDAPASAPASASAPSSLQADEVDLPSGAPQTMEMPAVSMTEPASFDFSLHGDDDVTTPSTAPSGQMFQFDAADDPALPSFPALADDAADEDLTTLPTMSETAPSDVAVAGGAVAGSAASTGATQPAGFDFAMNEPPAAATPTETSPVPAATETVATGGDMPSAYALDDLEPAAAGHSAAATTTSRFDDDTIEMPSPSFEDPHPATANVADDDFDLESLTAPAAVGVAGGVAAGSVAATPPADDFGADDFGATTFGATGTGYDNDEFSDFADFGSGLGGGTDGISAQTVYSILQPLLEELVGEVRRSLEYYGSRYPDAGVRRITLIGGGARFTNIDALFTQSLGIPTIVGNPLAHLPVRASRLPAGYAEQNGPIFAVALGLAMRDLV